MAAGLNSFIEIGAGKVLAGTLKRIDRKAACESYGTSHLTHEKV